MYPHKMIEIFYMKHPFRIIRHTTYPDSSGRIWL